MRKSAEPKPDLSELPKVERLLNPEYEFINARFEAKQLREDIEALAFLARFSDSTASGELRSSLEVRSPDLAKLLVIQAQRALQDYEDSLAFTQNLRKQRRPKRQK